MNEKQVKGTMFVDYIRMIRANKNLNWDPFLNEEDWEYINSRIQPAKWYPLNVYERCGMAVYKLLAKENPDLARLNGRERGKELFGTIYSSIVTNTSPMEALKKFVAGYGTFFNFSYLKFEKIGENSVRISHNYNENTPVNEPYCYQMMGYFDTLLELTGAKNSHIELSAKQWEGSQLTVFEIKWE